MPATVGIQNIPISAAISSFVTSEYNPTDNTIINGVYRVKCELTSSYVDQTLSSTSYPPIKIDWKFTKEAALESVYNVSSLSMANNVRYFDAHTNWTEAYPSGGSTTVPCAYFIPLALFSVYNCKDFVQNLRDYAPPTGLVNVSSQFDVTYQTIDRNPSLMVTFTPELMQYVASSNLTQGDIP